MAELTPADVESYTQGRLLAADTETQRLLTRALNGARHYCEWHVTPVIANDIVILDGSGDRLLVLPTKNLRELHSITEDGDPVDITKVSPSAGFGRWSRGIVRLRKQWPQRWIGGYSTITVDMTHGYDETEAEDFRVAVLDACDNFAKVASGGGGLKRLEVDDVLQEWFDTGNTEVAFNTNLLDTFKLRMPV